MEGHVLAPLLEANPRTSLSWRCWCPVDTMLVEVRGIGHYRLLGETLDDAAGEAFDKTAKLLGLGYPGGPALAKCAQGGNPKTFAFPRPMTDRPGLDFSFSGLKTHTRNLWAKHATEKNALQDIAAGFQGAVVDTLVIKCRRAMQQTRSSHLVVAGGVGANLALRSALTRDEIWLGLSYPARIEFCTTTGHDCVAAITACRLASMSRCDRCAGRLALDELRPASRAAPAAL
jgi:N6-L-threonylcarbamoyladenine synthase